MLGVCIIALGYEIYGSYAFNLAASLKVYQPDISITLLCEPFAIKHLTSQEKKFFDNIIAVDESDYTVGDSKQYQRVKLLVNKYTPYKKTFYMDADNIWLDKKVKWLFGELMDVKFSIGLNGFYDRATNRKTKPNYTYWCDSEKEVCDYFEIPMLCQTVSGCFYFEKCEWVDSMFADALKVYDDAKAPHIVWAGGKADEYCFNVALGRRGYREKDLEVFYFDKLNGNKKPEDIYSQFWGISTGGHIVQKNIIIIYNRLVNKYCTMLGIKERHYHINKFDVVPARKGF